MIAGGTGITPMYQVLQAIAANPADRRPRCCRRVTERDMLMEHELSAGGAATKLQVLHVLEKPGEAWSGPRGFIGEALVREHLQGQYQPLAEQQQQQQQPQQPQQPQQQQDRSEAVLLCGPPGMIGAMRTHLQKIGVPDAAVFKF